MKIKSVYDHPKVFELQKKEKCSFPPVVHSATQRRIR